MYVNSLEAVSIFNALKLRTVKNAYYLHSTYIFVSFMC